MIRNCFKLLATLIIQSLLQSSNGEKLAFGPGRIVGGEKTERNEVPYQVSVYLSDQFVCSGVVISETLVLVSGSCGYWGNSQNAYTVFAGDYSLRNNDGTEQMASVLETIVHPGFNSMRATNDIAILRLDRSLEYTDSVMPISLAPLGYHASGVGQVTGWGTTSENGPSLDILHKISLEILSDDDCRKIYDANEITDQMMCAGRAHDGVDVCNGDSGSPFVSTHEDEPYLVGIASWGRGCDKYPAVFTEISYYYSWICQYTEDCTDIL